MRVKIYMISMIILIAFAFTTTTYAQGMGGGHGGGGGMMGGNGGGGMMGSGGSGMTSPSQWMSKLWNLFSNNSQKGNQEKYRQREALRAQVQEKRQELESIVRSKNPDKALIDQKIGELDRLEAELDMEITAAEGMK